MPNEAHDELDETLIRQHLSDVTAKNTAWVLLQEPGFIGFGVVQSDKICLPPYPDRPINWTPDWARVSDLRLFGEKGEWHVWLDWERKHRCRLLEFDEKEEWHIWLGWDRKHRGCPLKSGGKTDTLPEYHALWGTEVETSDTPPWIKLTEKRGAEIWLPLAELKLTEKDLPLRLKLKQIVDYDPKYHLAGIVDAALVGLVRSSDENEKVIPPPSFTSCT